MRAHRRNDRSKLGRNRHCWATSEVTVNSAATESETELRWLLQDRSSIRAGDLGRVAREIAVINFGGGRFRAALITISLPLILPGLKLIATAGCLGRGASGRPVHPDHDHRRSAWWFVWRHAWDRIWPGASMGSCAVIGSCAFLGATSQGLISALVLVLELTRHLDATMVPMLLVVTGAMLVARRIESRSIYSVRLHLDDLTAKLAAPESPRHLGHLISQDFVTMSAATEYVQVVEHLLSSRCNGPVYILDHKGKLVGAIDAESLRTATLGAMPAGGWCVRYSDTTGAIDVKHDWAGSFRSCREGRSLRATSD